MLREQALGQTPRHEDIASSDANSTRTGRWTHSGTLKETIEVPTRHGAHTSTVMCYVTDIGAFDFILGMNWMDLHEATIKFGFGHSMAFESPHCTAYCLHHGVSETVYDDGSPVRSSLKPESDRDIHIISAAAAYKLTAHHPTELYGSNHTSGTSSSTRSHSTKTVTQRRSGKRWLTAPPSARKTLTCT
jgi:hypothetical protein